LALGQLVTVAGGIAATRILTGFLAPAAYGDLALALTLAGLLTTAGSGPVGNAVGRFFAVARENALLRSFFHAMRRLYGEYHLSACCVALAALLVYRAFVRDAAWLALGLAAVFLSMFQGACGLLDAAQNAARQRIVVAWHQAAGQWVRLLGAVLFIRWFGATANHALWGFVFASAIVLGSQFLFFRVRLAPLAAGELAPEETEVRLVARQMRAYANPFVAWAAIAWLQQASDRWLLAAFSSRVQVGLYQTLNQVGYSPLVQFSGLLSQVAAPILFAQAGDGSHYERVSRARQHVHQLSALLLAGTFTLAGVLWVLGSTIFALVVAPEYRSVARYLPLAALAGGFFATGQMLTTDALLRFRSSALIAPKIGSALLAAILNYVAARTFGLAGVLWASLISTAVYMLWSWRITRTASAQEQLPLPAVGTTAPVTATGRHANHLD